jgi:LPXTG-motif cell wall-anchored protein
MTRIRSAVVGLVAVAAGAVTLVAAAPANAQFANTGSIDPTSGTVGTTVAISGQALQCDTVEMFSFVGVQGNTVHNTIALNWDGDSFSGSATIPATRTDARAGTTVPLVAGDLITFFLNCASGPILVDFTFTAPPATTTTTAPATTTTAPFPPAEPPADADDFQGPLPADTPPGGTVVIAEPGFEPGETVVVVLYSDPKVLASVEADVNGEVRIAVALPSDTVPGAHTLVLFGETQVRKAPLNVLVLPAQVPGSTASTLPRTGPTRSTGPSTGAGIVLLVVGSGLVVLSSRRRAAA